MSEKDDKREIVSLRHKDSGDIMFFKVTAENNETIHSRGRTHYKEFYHIHRNLAVMPHEYFGRALTFKGYGEQSRHLLAVLNNGRIVFHNTKYDTWGAEMDATFLDDTPDIEITVKIGGVISTLSEISEETLLRIRNKSK